MPDITSIRYLPHFGESGSPARVNRNTGDLQINLSKWTDISPEHRYFILLHEKAHCVLNSSDEQAVDALAYKWYIESGYALTEALYALTRVLHSESPSNMQRMWNQYQRCQQTNKLNNKYSGYDGFDEISSDPSKKIKKVIKGSDPDYILVFYDEFEVDNFDLSELDQVQGLSRKEARKKKRAVKLYKKLQRGKKKSAVALDIEEGAKARKIYADQGIYVPTRAETVGNSVTKSFQAVAQGVGAAFGASTGSSELGGITDMIGGMMPNGNGSAPGQTIGTRIDNLLDPAAARKAKQQKTLLMFGGGAVALVVLIAIVKS